MRIIAYVLLLLIWNISKTSAQSIILNSTTEVNEKSSRLSGITALGYSSNMYNQNSINSKRLMSLGQILNYQISGLNIIRGNISGFKELDHGQEYKINDGFVAWANDEFWRKGEILIIGQQLRAIIPLSKESRQRDMKVTGFTVTPVFVFNLAPVGLRGVSLVFQPSGTKNVHTYKQNREYETNPEYSLSQFYAIKWLISDRLYFQPSFVYTNSWSYGGTKRDDAYQFATELGYSVIKSAIFAIGITNAGQVRNFENATDQSVQLYDRRAASVYSSIYFAF